MNYVINLEKIDFQKYDKKWQFCIGSGNAKLALQKDYQDQLIQVANELGFKRVRFHGIFNDGLYVVRSFDDLFDINIDTPHIREISFQQVGKVLDSVISCGMQPFIEIGMMPRLLASESKTIFKYKDYISMPKKMEEWNLLIEKFILFLIDRYSLEKVKTWYFEIWNEPDISNFFSGSQKDYFNLYANTVMTIKSICPDLIVGGPSTSKSHWITEFTNYCISNNIDYDFVSTHHYPGDALGHSFDRSKHQEKVQKVLAISSDSYVNVARSVLYNEEKIKTSAPNLLLDNAIKTKEIVRNKPVFYTEWNVTSNTVAPQNDSEMNSAPR